MSRPNRISKTLFRYRELSLNLTVMLDDERINIYEGKDNTTMYINTTVGLSFNLYDPDRQMTGNSIFVTVVNMNNLIRGFKKVLENMYTNTKLYSIDAHGKITLYSDEAKKSAVLIKLFDGKGNIYIIPSIVEDTNGQTYEGVNISLNNMSNTIGLPIDYLEALYYIISKVDLHMYGQTVLNYMEMRVKKDIDEYAPITKRKPQIIFREEEPKEAEIKSNIVQDEPDILKSSFGIL